MKKAEYIQTTAVIFGVIALLHAWRVLMQMPARIGGFNVPVWLSLLAIIVAGYLAYQGWQLSGKK